MFLILTHNCHLVSVELQMGLWLSDRIRVKFEIQILLNAIGSCGQILLNAIGNGGILQIKALGHIILNLFQNINYLL